MKILLLANTPVCPYLDGAGLRTYHLLRCLASRHSVGVLQVCPSPEVWEREAIGPPGAEGAWLRSACEAVWTVHASLGATHVRFGFLRDCSAVRQALRRALCWQPDVIWGHSALWGYYLPVGWLARTVLDVQDCYELSYRRRMASTLNPARKARFALKRLQYRRYARRHLEGLHALVMVNGADADSMAGLVPGARVEVVTNGVDAEHYARPVGWTEPDGAARLVFTGAMGADHNARAALYFARQVLPRTRRRIGECRFQIVGKAPGRQVRKLDERGRGVEVVGSVPDVRPYLWDAHAYVAPMVSGTGVKNKILEAWAAGCAVVSTSLGCESLAARDGLNILVSDEPDRMAQSLARLVREPALRKRLGEEGRATAVRDHRWETCADRFESILLQAAHDAHA